MSCGITLLGMYEVWELRWISQEEDRSVVCHQVPVSLIGLELGGEASGITSAVVGSRLATNGRESNGNGALFALLERIRQTQIFERTCGLVYTMGSCPWRGQLARGYARDRNGTDGLSSESLGGVEGRSPRLAGSRMDEALERHWKLCRQPR
jgi:hypothetical protein